MATERSAWLDVFDRRAKDARFSGGDLSEFGPEARTAWAAKVDSAALADNLAPLEPPSAEKVQARAEYMLPFNPTPRTNRTMETLAGSGRRSTWARSLPK